MDIFTHPLWFAPRIKSTKRRFHEPRHSAPATGRRFPPRRDWCDAQVTPLPRVLSWHILVEVNPATRRGPRRRDREPPYPPVDARIGTGMPQPSRAIEPGHQVALCPNRPAPDVNIGISPFSAPRGALSSSPTFAKELARDGALLPNQCRQPPTTGAAGQSREMPANAPGVRLLLIQNQIIEVFA